MKPNQFVWIDHKKNAWPSGKTPEVKEGPCTCDLVKVLMYTGCVCGAIVRYKVPR